MFLKGTIIVIEDFDEFSQRFSTKTVTCQYMLKYVKGVRDMLSETGSSSSSSPSSVSEVMEKYTMEIMKKLENRIPLQVKSFSDFSREYMKLLEEIFDIDYALENKMFGNFGMDEKAIRSLDNYMQIGSKFYMSQIDMSNEFFRGYLNVRLSVMESYNRFLKEFSKNVSDNADSKTGKKD